MRCDHRNAPRATAGRLNFVRRDGP
jgi:hypothetical protein